MKLIDPSFEVIKQKVPIIKPDKDKLIYNNEFIINVKKHIELAGRTCYKSENKITDDSYDKFFNMIENNKHLSVLEHGTLYYKISLGSPLYDKKYLWKIEVVQLFNNNPYSKVIKRKEHIDINDTTVDVDSFYITTNYRVIKESFNIKANSLIDEISEKTLFDYLCAPTEHHIKRISVKFICSRSIANELVRHRVFSFSQESQRYCNYSKDKFNSEITFIKPEYYKNSPKFEATLSGIEKAYFYLLGLGSTPQEAREVLPNATKTEIVMTGYIDDWNYFFKLRTAENAHPEMRRLIIPLSKVFNEINKN